jgi:hypothetical protein
MVLRERIEEVLNDPITISMECVSRLNIVEVGELPK